MEPKLKDMSQGIKDKFCYIVQSAYLKFPQMFRERFGIGTGMKLDDSFPNPDVSVFEEAEEDKIQIVYEFRISELEKWKKENK